MAGLGPRESCRNIYKDWKLLTVASIYILETIMYSITKDPLKQSHLHNHYTRQAEDYSLPVHRTVIFGKKLSYARLKLFNKLPQHVKEYLKDHNPRAMKKTLQSWLQDKAFYMLYEFTFWNEVWGSVRDSVLTDQVMSRDDNTV
ncbi:hypothetical protein J6590_022994 [Homalodisca vitripennis]|nr:hypothetical protein J6590_022994 [Homalodisca vitripennis]